MPSPNDDRTNFEKLDFYYRTLAPRDIYGNLKFQSAEANLKINPNERVFSVYLNSTTSGKKIIDELKDLQLEGKGVLFNTAYQGKADESTTYLEDEYWRPSNRFPESDASDKKKINNFYKEVCGVSENPPRAFTVNVLRSPMLSEARKNTGEIEFFLNYMPSIFPSQMVPYFSVEFQLPQTVMQSNNNNQLYLQRPSLLRFLMGSQIDIAKMPLTAADQALLSVVDTRVKSRENPAGTSQFIGMEMFTTPQTLSNMEELGVTQGRLNQVKPFLPPASILGASIQIMNAGAGKFAHKKADMELKIHDKARIVEFSEFLRGGPGHRDTTVWLTYGWLAPRNRGDDDAYAKFINENMLVREAFTLKNSSFSFDNAGQVSVKLELVSKGFATVESALIQTTQKTGKTILEQLSAILARIQKNRAAFGAAPEGLNKEIRIFQVLDAAAAGDTDFDIPEDELKGLLDSASEAIKNSKTIVDKAAAQTLIEDVARLYGKKKDQKVTNIKNDIFKEIKDFNSKNFAKCSSQNSPDPFLPDQTKKVKDYLLYSSDLVRVTNEQAGPVNEQAGAQQGKVASKGAKGGKAPTAPDPSRRVTSFGKVFSVFCLPALLNVASEENIDEVQVSFYQLNESCGPVSLHSIAEFPIDLAMLETQFSEFAVARGGEAMTVQEFLQFIIDTQIGDNRSPGYGMRSFYEPYDINKPSESVSGDEANYNKKMTEWAGKYGSYKKPSIAIKMETTFENTSNTKINLLDKLQSTVGAAYNEPLLNQTDPNVKKIKKIHIYDKQLNPYTKEAQLLRADDGSYTAYDGEPAREIASEMKQRFPGFDESSIQNFVQRQIENSDSFRVARGKDVLRNYVGNTVPRLIIGANGSLITNASLASKTDGLLGTNNMLGGSFKAKSTLAPNGLSMAENNIPMRIMPAQLTLTSMGCPIADLYQTYFVDFGTGTTLDAMYACTQLSHNFGPGKFETSWTFAYTDGYGKFFGAPNIKELLKNVDDATGEKQGTPGTSTPTSVAPTDPGKQSGPTK